MDEAAKEAARLVNEAARLLEQEKAKERAKALEAKINTEYDIELE